jgi:hypothetical protein
MTRFERFHRWLSPALFAVVALCFLLPFATVSCDGASTSFTGIQLVTHTVPRGGSVSEAPDCSADISVCVEHDGSAAAEIAFAAVLIGLVLGVLGIRRGPGWCVLAGLVTLGYLPFAGPLVGPEESFHYGYGLAFLLLLAIGVLQIGRAGRRRRRRRRLERALRGAPDHRPWARVHAPQPSK